MVIAEEIEARMLEKSYIDEVTVEELSDGAFRTRSARTPHGRSYLTTANSCTCPATAHCKHIARVRYELARPAQARCAVCHGTGEVAVSYRISATDYRISWELCPHCMKG